MMLNIEKMDELACQYPHAAIKYARMGRFRSFLIYLKFGPDYEAILKYLGEEPSI